MFYCGYMEHGEEASEKENDFGSDDAIRKQNSMTSPKPVTSLPEDITNSSPVHGQLYFLSNEQGFCKCNLRNGKFETIDTGFLKDTGYTMKSFYIDPVYEEIILLLVKIEFNYEQQVIMKWRPGKKDVDESEFFSLYQLDEDEKAAEISGTVDFGIVHTSKERVWMVEHWHSK